MKIFYLNLAREADRRDYMEAQLTRLGLDATRIEAVDAAGLGSAERAHVFRLDHSGSKTTGYCVTLSHLKAMRAFLATDAPHALILEDDVVLAGRLPEFLAAFDETPPALDMLRLETVRTRLRTRPPEGLLLGFGICRAHSFEPGRAAYILNRKAAEVMVQSPHMLRIPHDISMFDPYQPLPRQLVVRQLKPALAVQLHLKGPETADKFIGPPLRPTPLGEMGWLPAARKIYRAVHRDTVIAVLKIWHGYVHGAHKERIPYVDD
jgi:glycosyl transferase family 25